MAPTGGARSTNCWPQLQAMQVAPSGGHHLSYRVYTLGPLCLRQCFLFNLSASYCRNVPTFLRVIELTFCNCVRPKESITGISPRDRFETRVGLQGIDKNHIDCNRQILLILLQQIF